MKKAFWLYVAGASLIAAAYVDFPLIAFHFSKTAVTEVQNIPLYYASAMITESAASLLLGKLFDRLGIFTVALGILFSIAFPPLVFLGGAKLALLGMICWGVGMAAQGPLLRAAISNIVPPDRKGSAFGLFNSFYGVSWFIGSAAMGVIYTVSVPWVVAFSMVLQGASLALLLPARKGIL